MQIFVTKTVKKSTLCKHYFAKCIFNKKNTIYPISYFSVRISKSLLPL